jgi:Tfp pilus assembly protein PilF
MKSRQRLFRYFALLAPLVLGAAGLGPVIHGRGGQAQQKAGSSAASAREAAYRSNNIGVALLEQYKYEEAAARFRQALKTDRAVSIAHLNLCIALFNEPDLPGALIEAKIAAGLLRDAPGPQYMLGLIARGENRVEDAIAAFSRVHEIDPNDGATNVNLGQLYAGQRNYPEAIKVLRQAIAGEPYNITAAYNLAIALQRSGQRDESQRMMDRFTTLRQSGYGTALGQKYLEQGRYAEAVTSTGLEPDLVDTSTPNVTFADLTSSYLQSAGSTDKQDSAARESVFGRTYKAADMKDSTRIDIASSLAGGVVLFDYDGDGDLDMFVVTSSGQRLYRNDGGKFVDVTREAGLADVPPGSIGISVVAGDYDNDGKPDLFVLRYGRWSLYHNDGGGKFSEAAQSAGIPAYPYLAVSAAFVDVDHDGDLDIFVAGLADLSTPAGGDPNRSLTFPDDFAAAPNLLLRNDGNGKFTDITTAAKVSGAGGHAVAIVPTDFDNHRDVDLFVLNYGKAPNLYSNQRDGSFRDVAAEVGLGVSGRFTSAAASDVNKDGFTDFFLGRSDGPGLLALSDGHTRFTTTDAPAGSESATAAQFLDYDQDGLLDLAVVSKGELHILRNAGGKFVDVSDKAVSKDLAAPSQPGAIRSFAAGDLDGCGYQDLVLPGGWRGFRIARNNGENSNHTIHINPAGKVSNRSGVGSKVEVRAGSLWQKLETSSASPAPVPADVIFGLGKRAAPDAVRVLWPSGIVQAEIDFSQTGAGRLVESRHCALAPAMAITELDRKPSSCPFLYTWDGDRFEFITDFMGGGEMGSWEGPGQRNIPDPDEYVRIRGDQLKPRDGRYEIRVTNELEEVLYVDRLQLVAITHPEGTEVFPNEGLKDPPRPPFKLYCTQGARPPVSAVDDNGHDELAALTQVDRKFVDTFELDRIRGFAKQHSLTLDLGEAQGQRTLLLMTGWTDYAFSSDAVAASQRGLKMEPPSVQVKDSNGEWKTVIEDMGFPVGRPQTIVVDLKGKFLSASRQVRIVTNMRIYWDQVLVDSSEGESRIQMTRLDPVSANLHWRGYSAQVSPDGREPYGYDYSRVTAAAPWKHMPGRYTREGDVRELVLRSDDMFVVSRPGDEIALQFDAKRLAPLAPGWKRTFLLYADGFSKEMDINSASPDAVAPLPFHRMKRYPYGPDESYPMTAERRRYLDRFNTRVVTDTIPSIDLALFLSGGSYGLDGSDRSGGSERTGKPAH